MVTLNFFVLIYKHSIYICLKYIFEVCDADGKVNGMNILITSYYSAHNNHLQMNNKK